MLSPRLQCIPRARHGFSLVELLVVLSIIAVLTAVSVPALSSVMSSFNLSAASQAIVGQLTYARQDALANNRAVQIRFYQVADYKGNAVYRAVQAFRETTDSSGATTVTPITKPYFLPSAMWIVYSSTVTSPSTLLTTSGAGASGAQSSTGDTANPLPSPYGASPYVYFRFRPNGQTDLSVTSLLTIAWETAPIRANNLPANFITLQIDAINGSVRTFQP